MGAGVHVGAHAFGLVLPLLKGFGNLVVQPAGLLVDVRVFHVVVQHGVTCCVVFAAQLHGTEMHVVDAQRVAVVADVHVHRLVGRAVVGLHHACVDDAVFAEDGQTVLVTVDLAQRQI